MLLVAMDRGNKISPACYYITDAVRTFYWGEEAVVKVQGNQECWLLPEGVQDVLPARAQALESLRRQALDLYARYGYELVFPPLLEFRESLLTGVGHDLALSTFTLMDPLSGRSLGLRADITPQVARIDASQAASGVRRYAYAGTVVSTQAKHLGASRCSVQFGCELYGYAGLEADLELLELLVLTLQQAGCRRIILELGHVGILRGLVESCALEPVLIERIFAILQRKARAEFAEVVDVATPEGQRLAALLELSGDPSVLDLARQSLQQAPEKVVHALAEVQRVVDYLTQRFTDVELYVDLAELRGYHYHTGLFFAAYTDNHRFEVAKGGRYDAVGAAFGQARPATGFSVEALMLCGYQTQPPCIYAPPGQQAELVASIERLRAAGKRVVQRFPEEAAVPLEAGDQELVWLAGQWQLRP